jgi:four helix bundle protein
MRENLVQKKSFDFALNIIGLYQVLSKEKEYVISKQLLRSAVSIGANIEEAETGQSKRDFMAKMAIASKEAKETKYWLLLLNASQLVKYDYRNLIDQVEEIIRLLTKIVKTTKQNLKLNI